MTRVHNDYNTEGGKTQLDNETMVKLIQGGNVELIEKLCADNRRLVYSVANKYQAYAEIDDLVQEGYSGLIEAVESFVCSSGTKFSTYAHFFMIKNIERFVRGCNALYIPSYMNDRIRAYKRACADLIRKGHEPTAKELCAVLGLSAAQLQAVESAIEAQTTKSIHEPITEEGLTVGDLIADDTDIEQSVIDDYYAEELKREVWRAVDTLPAAQGEAIKMYYIDRVTFREGNKMTEYDFAGMHRRGLFNLKKNHKELKRFLEGYECEADYIETKGYKGGFSMFKDSGERIVERVALKLY